MGEQRITIVTGPRDSGKTSWMMAEYQLLGGRGIIMPKVFDEYSHLGYDILLLPSQERMAVCRRKKIVSGEAQGSEDPSAANSCRWDFDEEIFSAAESRIREAPDGDCNSPFFIDEIGALELEGGGFSNLLSSLLARRRLSNQGDLYTRGDLYIGMRLNLVRDLIKKFAIPYTDILFLRLR